MAVRGGSIYVIRNLLNGKCYVGQTRNRAFRRVQDHLHGDLAELSARPCEVFEFRVPRALLDDFEVSLIQRLRTLVPSGYNLSLGGQKKRTFGTEAREKMRIAHLGRKLSAEHRLAISTALKGKPKSPEHVRAAALGHEGRALPFEHRARISRVLKGRAQSDERKQRHRLIMKKWWDERKEERRGREPS